ncbi:hypothetical protein OG762_52280 (plasmid) [Streptomyces sp. NBC_01136]|uniref:hypothetical protein n=1 Tax=Streptomyces sp. NBC_01136 TaxID=2903754 RepID=UPI002F910A86|nr:hypothetical protein OG762_52280 [Streptomyces sp. NBC_01136]
MVALSGPDGHGAEAPETGGQNTTTESPDPSAAVLYVCAERGTSARGLPAERAVAEGRKFAEARGLALVETVTDPYGEPDPCHRQGWQRVRELAASAAVGVVIARWPACIAPDASHELRHREVRWLQDHGVRVRYSWAPLAAGGEVR